VLVVTDSVEIDALPGDVWSWLCELPRHYTAWHPAHHGCTAVRGRPCEPGAVLEFDEDLHGRRHRFRVIVLDVTPGRELQYRVGFWLKGRFRVEPAGARSRFTAELSFGLPGLGWLIDPLAAALFRRRIEAVRQHQKEEGESLRKMLEAPDDDPDLRASR
jgi:uncharacterized protein YndB with AHSA1/START domain